MDLLRIVIILLAGLIVLQVPIIYAIMDLRKRKARKLEYHYDEPKVKAKIKSSKRKPIVRDETWWEKKQKDYVNETTE